MFWFDKIKVKHFAVVMARLNAIVGFLETLEIIVTFCNTEYSELRGSYNYFTIIDLSIWIALTGCAIMALYAMYQIRPWLLIPYMTFFCMSLLILVTLTFFAFISLIVDLKLEKWIFHMENRRRFSPRTMGDVWYTILILLICALLNMYFVMGTFFEDSILKDKLPTFVKQEDLEIDDSVIDKQSLQSWQTSASWLYVVPR